MTNYNLSKDNTPSPAYIANNLGTGISPNDENEMLRQKVEDLESKVQMYKQEGGELIEFNKELQWTLIMLKKDNE